MKSIITVITDNNKTSRVGYDAVHHLAGMVYSQADRKTKTESFVKEVIRKVNKANNANKTNKGSQK